MTAAESKVMKSSLYFAVAILGVISPTISGPFAPHDQWVRDGKSAVLREYPEFTSEQLVVVFVNYGYVVSHLTPTNTNIMKNVRFRLIDEANKAEPDSNERMTWYTILVTFNEDDTVQEVGKPKKNIANITKFGSSVARVYPGKRHYLPRPISADTLISDILPRHCETGDLFQIFADLAEEELLVDEDVYIRLDLDVEYDHISGIDDAINVIRAVLGARGIVLEPIDSNRSRAKRKRRTG
jgi:hypothetical protein